MLVAGTETGLGKGVLVNLACRIRFQSSIASDLNPFKVLMPFDRLFYGGLSTSSKVIRLPLGSKLAIFAALHSYSIKLGLSNPAGKNTASRSTISGLNIKSKL